MLASAPQKLTPLSHPRSALSFPRFPHPNQFVCAIDTFPQHNMALASLSNVPNTGTDTGIAIYDTNPWGVR